MPGTAVVTDSTAYLPDDVCQVMDIHRVSLYINWGTHTERESEITDYTAFYEKLRTSDDLPTTSQPSVGDFLEEYERLFDRGYESIVSIHLSGGISGTVDSALQAAAQIEQSGRDGRPIKVIDSTTACGGLGILTLAAARLASTGSNPGEIEQRLSDIRSRLKAWFAVDTLEFLRRGGRIGAASAWIGSTLKIKPILTIENEIKPVERVRTRARSFERLVDYARQRKQSGADGWAVQHVQDEENASQLNETCREIMGCEPLFFSEVGPVIGAHVGPGLLGFGAAPAYLWQ